MKFKIKDRVKLVSQPWSKIYDGFINEIGTVTEVDDVDYNLPYLIKFNKNPQGVTSMWLKEENLVHHITKTKLFEWLRN